jgi:hypothetical protein
MGRSFQSRKGLLGQGLHRQRSPPETKGLAGRKAVNAKSVISGGF